MRVGAIDFEWWLYEEPIRTILYNKAKVSGDFMVLFSPKDINVNFIIKSDVSKKFIDWLKKGKIASSVKEVGKNSFECILTDSFMDEMSDKEIFINMEKKQ